MVKILNRDEKPRITYCNRLIPGQTQPPHQRSMIAKSYATDPRRSVSMTNHEDGFLQGKRYLIMDRDTEFSDLGRGVASAGRLVRRTSHEQYRVCCGEPGENDCS